MVGLRTQDDPKDLETNTTLAKLMASFLALLFFFFLHKLVGFAVSWKSICFSLTLKDRLSRETDLHSPNRVS